MYSFDFENLCYYENVFTLSVFFVRTKKHATVYMGCGTYDVMTDFFLFIKTLYIRNNITQNMIQ